MPIELLVALAGAVFLIAVLYSSVGHAGASGYIAVMTLFGLAPAVIKPTALALNILVASIATLQFARSGHFSWKLFWPFALLAVPAAFIGGYVALPAQVFKVVLGLVLLFAAFRLLVTASAEKPARTAPLWIAVACGAGIGLLAGLTGTGGGIFLTPLLLFMGWATPRQAAAVSALFILLNSTAGLLGNVSSTRQLPSYLWVLLVAAAVGGAVGSYLGSNRVPATTIKRLLAGVLLIAGGKLVLA